MRCVISHSHSDHVSSVFAVASFAAKRAARSLALSEWQKQNKKDGRTQKTTERINLYFIPKDWRQHPSTDIGRTDVTTLRTRMNESRMKNERSEKVMWEKWRRRRWKTLGEKEEEGKKPHHRNYVLSFGFIVSLRRKSRQFRRSSLSTAIAEHKSIQISSICHCHRHGHGSPHISSMLMASIKSVATPTNYVCNGIARV